MMKKTTQTLLLVFSTLLLLASVTVSAQGQPSNRPNFTGTWNAVTDKGKKIVITLRHDRSDFSVVTGNYLPDHGLTGSYKPSDSSTNRFVRVSAFMAGPVLQTAASINGRVTDNVLRFTWAQDNAQGAGRFTLSSDGESFKGTYSRTNNPDDTSGGTWNGTRQHSFAGAWQGKLGESFLELILQQSGDRVTGQFNVNSNHDWFFRDGIVVGNTLRFTVVRRNIMALPNARNLPDEALGSGELVIDRGGKSFTGIVLGAATSGTLVGR